MLNITLPSNRLETIATRQSKNRVRDAFFAACVALAAALSIATVSAASHAAATGGSPVSSPVAQR
jgi:uncharacterized membrane protein SirB2